MGRPKGSKNKKKESVVEQIAYDKEVKDLIEGVAKEEAEVENGASEVVVSKKDSPSVKWNAMTFDQRKEAVQYMMDHGYINASLKLTVSAMFCGREEENTRFGDLLFNAQDAVSSYFRKR